MLGAQGRSGGQTATKILLEAMANGQVHLARFVLDALDGEIVDSKTEDARTPLISSVLLPEGHARCKFVELLLQRGASVNRPDGNGRTALSYACEQGYLDAVKTLVRNNADPEIVDTWGNTALMYAVGAGHASVVDFLVRAFKRLGLQVDRRNKVGNSAVKVAHFLGHAECICALKSASGKRSVTGRDGQGAAGQRLDTGDGSDKLDDKVGRVVTKLELLRTKDRETLQIAQNYFLQQRLRKKQSRLPSMGSIEEAETENCASSSTTQELDFSGLPIPKNSKHPSDPITKFPKTVQSLTASDDRLPPLSHHDEAPKHPSSSPRPNRNTFEPRAQPLMSILMTPISERGLEPTKTACGAHRFHHSYYQKRCSLPTSFLSPTPPERALELVRKSKTVKRREASPCADGALRGTAAPAAASTASFSALGDKLLRRFTSPEFRKHDKVSEDEPAAAPGRMPRSETFPQDITHPQVGSKPSIDSISSVMCEFDFHLRTQKF